MGIPNTEIPRVQYEAPIAAGTSLPLATFTYSNKTDVKVLKGETPLLYNIDYTVGASSVTLVADSDENITIYRSVPLIQDATFPQTNRFNSNKMNNSLDTAVRQITDQSEKLGRAIKLPLSAPVALQDLTLPLPDSNKGIKWNAAGTGLQNTTYDPDEVAYYTDEAAASAATAATQAGIATTQAGNAAASAAQALADKNAISAGLTQLNGIGILANLLTTAKDTLVNAINELVVRMDDGVDKAVVTFGSAPSSITLTADAAHTATFSTNSTINLPTLTGSKPRNFMLDFNVQPGRTLTFPSGIKWDYDLVPTFSYSPNVVLNIATISNMIITSTNTANTYCQFTGIPMSLYGVNPWEEIWFVPGFSAVSAVQEITGTSTTYSKIITINASNKAVLYLSSNGTSHDIANGVASTVTTFATGQGYYFKLYFSGTQYILYSSTNYNPVTQTGTWTTEVTVTSSAKIYQVGNYLQALANTVSSTQALRGTLDLTKSSVKLNGGVNLLAVPSVYKNRVIIDTLDNGTSLKGYYSQNGA